MKKTLTCCLTTTVIVTPDKDGHDHKCSTTVLMDKASHKEIACGDAGEEVSGAVDSATSQLIRYSEQYGDDEVGLNGNIYVTLTANVIGEDKSTIYVTDATYEINNPEEQHSAQQDDISGSFDDNDPYHSHWNSSEDNVIDDYPTDIMLDRQSVEKAVTDAFNHRLFSKDWKILVQLNGGMEKNNGKDDPDETRDFIIEGLMNGMIPLDQVSDHFKAKLKKVNLDTNKIEPL